MKEILRKILNTEKTLKTILRRIVAYMLNQYTTVLFVLAASIIVSYLVVIYDLKKQEGNPTLIKLSAEQSQLVLAVNFHATKLIASNDKVIVQRARGNISNLES